MDTKTAILSRRSCRRYRSALPEHSLLEEVIEAGRYAPSGSNSQRCHFTVVCEPRVLTELAQLVKKIFAGMSYDENSYISLKNSIRAAQQGDYVFHYHAPVLVIVSSQPGYGNAMADSACALENMMLMAHALGLGSCWINQLHWLEREPELRAWLARLGIPADAPICGSLALGYPEQTAALTEKSSLPRHGNSVSWIEALPE